MSIRSSTQFSVKNYAILNAETTQSPFSAGCRQNNSPFVDRLYKFCRGKDQNGIFSDRVANECRLREFDKAHERCIMCIENTRGGRRDKR